MPATSVLVTFCAASLVLMVLPGPAVIYVVSQTVRLGLGRGLVGALGIECGTLVHAVAATLGLTALLTRSDLAFAAVKYAGVVYLLVLGWRQLRNVERRGGGPLAGPTTATSAWEAFRQGFVVEALNPKTALFFVAFLPQFVDHGAGHETLQVGLLGGAFVALALVVDATYAVVAATARRRLGRRLGAGRRVDQAGGVALLALAAFAAAP